MRSTLSLLLICLSLVACGKKKQEVLSSTSEPSNSIAVSSDDVALQLAKNATVSCPTNDCNPSIGKLSSANGNRIGTCTASLIGPDLAITNSHCIADDLKTPLSSCRGRMWIAFAKSSENQNYDSSLECDRVLFASSEGDPSDPRQDYALLRLTKNSNRPSLRVHRGGFIDAVSYTVEKVNPVYVRDNSNKIVSTAGIQEKISCAASLGTTIFPLSHHRHADLITLTDCSIMEGNSGGPILDSNQNIRGLVQIYLNGKATKERLAQNNSTDVIWPSEIADMTLGSNMSCMNLYWSGLEFGEVPEECSSPIRHSKYFNIDDRKPLVEFVKPLFSELASKQSYPLNSIRWDFKMLSESRLTVRPLCLEKRSKDADTQSAEALKNQYDVITEFDRLMRQKFKLAPSSSGLYFGANVKKDWLGKPKAYVHSDRLYEVSRCD